MQVAKNDEVERASGYVLLPKLDEPGGYVSVFEDGSYTSWVPEGTELDTVPVPAPTPIDEIVRWVHFYPPTFADLAGMLAILLGGATLALSETLLGVA